MATTFYVLAHALAVLFALIALFIWYLIRRMAKNRADMPAGKLKKFRFYKKKIIYREDGRAYLVRYSLFSCRWFAIKVHHILLSDYSCMHDHPWGFITLILRGGYLEHTTHGSRYQNAGRLLYRPASFVHRLEVFKPVWTFVITFKKTQPWGFYTRNGWVFWRAYNPTNSCE